MNVFTYYDDSLQMPDQSELICIWKKSWSRNGVEPRVLTPAHAHSHPRYQEFLDHINTLPTVNSRSYENACYLRWLAFDIEFGGWMTDYDVINFEFVPADRINDVELFEYSCVPCMVWATPNGAKQIVQRMFDYSPNDGVELSKDGPRHCSDMYAFIKYFSSCRIAKPECVQFDSPGWESAPAVHFSASGVHAHYKSPVPKSIAIKECGRSL